MSCKKISTLLLALAITSAHAQPTEPVAPAPNTDEVVVVTGTLPGPPLWKVVNGDNVMWIFALPDYAPAKMHWDTTRVARIVTDAELYLSPPSSGIAVTAGSALKLLNPITITRGTLLMKKLSRDPEGKTLKESLTPELYQRFSTLKSKYFPKNKRLEKLRPLVVMDRDNLAEPIFKAEKLTGPQPIRAQLEKVLKKNKELVRFYPTASVNLTMSYKEIAERAENFMQSLPREEELRCFGQELSRLEVDMNAVKRRANAWALGDIVEYREIALQIPAENPCLTMLAVSSEGDLFSKLETEKTQRWLAAAETALQDMHKTIAVLPIEELMNNNGLLAQLQSKGYQVIAPDD